MSEEVGANANGHSPATHAWTGGTLVQAAAPPRRFFRVRRATWLKVVRASVPSLGTDERPRVLSADPDPGRDPDVTQRCFRVFSADGVHTAHFSPEAGPEFCKRKTDPFDPKFSRLIGADLSVLLTSAPISLLAPINLFR